MKLSHISRVKIVLASTGPAKPLCTFRGITLLTLLAAVSAWKPPLRAQTTIYWDVNGATAGSGNAGGTWDQSTILDWTTTAAGTAATNTWGNFATGANSIAYFSAGTDGTGTFTVTTSGTITNVGGITFNQGNVAIGGSGILTLSQNATVTSTASGAISANITDGANTFSLTKAGANALTLSGNNTYNGGTTLNAGTLNLNSATALGTGTFTIAGGTIDNTSGGALTLTNNNAQAWNSPFTFTGTNDLNLGTGAVTLGIAADLTINGGNLTVGGVISGGHSLTKDGSGTLTLTGANTYGANNTGTVIHAGTIAITSIANIDAGSSALGSASSTKNNGTVSIGSGTTGAALQYIGSGNDSTNRVINLAGTTGGATLDSSGTGTISFTSAFTATGAGSKTLTLAGTNTGANTISGAIVDNSATNTTSLAKTGAGTWVLSGASTYTGTTNITGGTLQISGAANTTWLGSNTAGGAVNISNGGTLDIGGVTAANVVNFGTKQFNISGAGVGGNGAIVNSSATNSQNNAFQNITLTGDATIGGASRFDTRGGTPTLDLAGHTLTKTGTNQVSVVAGTITSGDITVNQGEFAIQTSTNATGTGTFTFNNGTTLGLWTNTGSVTRDMVFNGTNTILNEKGPSTIGSNLTINGSTTFNILSNGTASLTLTGQLSGAGTAILNSPGTGATLILGANQTNFFNGTLDLNAGTLDLAGFNLTVNTLHITGDSTIDFGAGVASILSTANFIIDPGVTLTIADWVNTVDYFYAQNFSGAAYNIRGIAPENQVAFTGFSNNSTLWQSYDSQITPVPESAIYGALLTAAALGLFLWHRRKTSATDPALCAVHMRH